MASVSKKVTMSLYCEGGDHAKCFAIGGHHSDLEHPCRCACHHSELTGTDDDNLSRGFVEAAKRLITTTLTEKQDLVDRTLQEIYTASERTFRPMFPWVFIMTLKKEQFRNGLWLPGSNQNKTVGEGIVISLWKPTTRVINGKTIAYTTELSLGDHVLFNHWSGVPVSGWPSERFRLVKECNWAVDKEGGIFATCEYQDRLVAPVAALYDILRPYLDNGYTMDDDVETQKLTDTITNRFLLVDRDQESRTISGR